MKTFLLITILAFTGGYCLAQEPVSTDSEKEIKQEAVPSENEEQPVDEASAASARKEDLPSRGFQALSEDVMQSVRRHWGFSLGAYEDYSTDSVPAAGGGLEAATITSLAPRMFFNLGRHKSKFHMDLGAGYRLYRHHKELNSWDYAANANYSYQFTRDISLELSNSFTSSANDSSSFLSPFPSILNIYPTTSSEVLFDGRQRIVRDFMNASLGFKLTRKARLAFSSTYDSYSYEQKSITDTHALGAGVEFEYALTKWLNFSSDYHDYLNKVDASNRAVQIHRLRVGGFNFKLTRFWRIWTNGGIDYTRYNGTDQYGENVDAGIGYESREFSLSAAYNRGFSSASGLSQLMQSDSINGNLGYRFTQRVSTRLSTYYTRSRELLAAGTLKTLTGTGSLEFALRNDLFLSLNGSYQDQRELNFSYGNLNVNRLSVYVGLQYVWPSRQRGD
jgi:hypothetical protein